MIGLVTNVTIVGYRYIDTVIPAIAGSQFSPPPPLDPPDPVLGNVYTLKTGFTPPNPTKTTDYYGNVWGVPWIIGAKRGFPNFNDFSMQDVVKVTRKLQVTRPTTNSPPNATNQMYVISVTNSLGVDFWNSYTNGYTNTSGNIQVVVSDNLSMQMVLTNGMLLLADGHTLGYDFPSPFFAQANFNIWPGNAFPDSVRHQLSDSHGFGVCVFPAGFYFVGSNPNPTFQVTSPTFAPLPQLLLQVTNRLQAFILDKDVNGNSHVIDYVHFTGPGTSRNLNSEFQNLNTFSVGSPYTNLIWSAALETPACLWEFRRRSASPTVASAWT